MGLRPVALQLYSLREAAGKNFPEVLEKVASFGYKGVEFAGLNGMSPGAVRKILDDLGLVACSTHGPLPQKENLSQIIDEAGTLGYEWQVVAYMPPENYSDKEETLKTIDAFAQGAELLKGSGLRLAAHNHWWEFDKRFDGKTPHEMMMERIPGLFAEVDTYWAQVAGADAVGVVRHLGKRAPLLHIKDGPLLRDQPMTAVGGGKMDWKAIFAAAGESLEWPVVELDSCATDMFDAVRESCRYLIDNGFAAGASK